MSNNTPGDPNNSNSQPDLNPAVWEQLKKNWDQILGKQQKFKTIQEGITKEATESSKVFGTIYTDAIKGIGSYSAKHAELQREISKTSQKIAELTKMNEQSAQVFDERTQKMKGAYTEEINSLDKYEKKLKDNAAALKAMAEANGENATTIGHLSEVTNDAVYLQQRYGGILKGTSQAILGLTGSIAGAIGGAKSLNDYFSKGFEGFSQIKEANKDFLALQYTLANVGKVDFGKMGDPATALGGNAKAMRAEALQMMQDFGMSFKEATASISRFGSIHPVTSSQAEDWQATSIQAARLAQEMKNTFGISEDLSRSLFKQDIQGQGKDMGGFTDTLKSTASAMKSLKMDSDAFTQTLSGLMQRTALYNVNNQQLITTLNNVGSTQLRLNEAQKQALAQTMTQGVAGMDFSSVIKETALMRQSGLSKKYGLTGNATEDYGRMQLEMQKNPTGLTADMIRSQAIVRRQGLDFDLGSDQGKAKAMGILALSQQANPEMDLTGLRQSILGANKGQSMRSLLDTLSGTGVQKISDKEMQGRQDAFKNMGIDQFSISKMLGVEQIGEQLSPILDPISKLLGNTSAGILGSFGTANLLLMSIATSTGIMATANLSDAIKNITNLTELFPFLKSIPSMLAGPLGSIGSKIGTVSGFLEVIVFPLAVIGASIVTLANGLQGFSQFFNAKNSKDQFSGIATMLGFGQKGGGAGAAMSGAIGGGAIGLLIGSIAGPVGAAVGAAIGGLLGALAGYFDLGSQFEKLGDYIDQTFGKQGTNIVRQMGLILIGGPFGMLLANIQSLNESFDTAGKDIESIGGAISGAVDGLKTFIGDFFKGSLGTINLVLSGIWKFMEPIVKWVQSVLPKPDQDTQSSVSNALQGIIGKDAAEKVGAAAGSIAGALSSASNALTNLTGGTAEASMIDKTTTNYSPESLKGSRLNDSQKRAMSYLMSKGLSSNAALGITANLTQESGLRTGAVGDHGTSFGIAQWHNGRATAGAQFMGTSWKASTLEQQLGFLYHEIQSNPKLLNSLKSSKSPEEAADVFVRKFERPADPAGQSRVRQQIAAKLAAEMNRAPNIPVAVHQPIPRPTDKGLASTSKSSAGLTVNQYFNIKSVDPKQAAIEAAQRTKRSIQEHHEILTKDKGSKLNA